MASPLADLDELILKCRDQKSKNYIKEAVACYKAGAFRSAIISTWIAVSFDIINKLEELALAGDPLAKQKIQVYDSYLNSNNIKGFLEFEKELLTISKDNLELISIIEYEDLMRLSQDRNRCAHPSMALDKTIFNPSAEQVRVHIRSAVEYLLQYPPAQGKNALKILTNKLESSLFPTDLDEVIIVFEHSPLNKARYSLIRNFIIMLIKELFSKSERNVTPQKCIVALQAINHLHREVFEKTLTEKLSPLIDALPEDQLYLLVLLIENINDIWNYLNPDIQNKLKKFLEELKTSYWCIIKNALTIPYLKDATNKRLETIANSGFAMIPYLDEPPTAFLDNLISYYVSSTDYSKAMNTAHIVISYAQKFTSEQVKEIILRSGSNYSVNRSFNFPNLLDSLKENNNLTTEQFNECLCEAGLTSFSSTDPENVA